MIELEDLLSNVLIYNCNVADLAKIRKAYKLAEELHRGQYRQSGEAYIYHPLNVSYILSEMHADCDTICAGLLHETLEDCDITKEEIASEFGVDVANLVDGVTKISRLNYSSKEEQNFANTRKIILGITTDVRIIIIKLADRLHNMRTLQSKSEFKQKENAIETMEIFVPIAYYIGAYKIKSELEDLSLQYLKPDSYNKVREQRIIIERDSHDCLEEMLTQISTILNDNDIPSDIKIRTKNIYGIYKALSQGGRMSDIHDLLAMKIIVDKISECYLTLGLVHSKYKPINERFKDYICNPKTNMYQSLHTSVFGEDNRIVQTQIRTHQMDQIATFGLTAYWDLNQGDARTRMQEDLREKCQFFNSLLEISKVFGDNQIDTMAMLGRTTSTPFSDLGQNKTLSSVYSKIFGNKTNAKAHFSGEDTNMTSRIMSWAFPKIDVEAIKKNQENSVLNGQKFVAVKGTGAYRDSDFRRNQGRYDGVYNVGKDGKYKKTNERKDYIMLGVLASTLPMIHTHSFLALGVISFGMFVTYFFKQKDKKSSAACLSR